jgi:hypothetical protein
MRIKMIRAPGILGNHALQVSIDPDMSKASLAKKNLRKK